MSKFVSAVTILLFAGVWCAPAQEASDRFYQAIRNNDLAALRDLAKPSDVNTKDQREHSPLMYAAQYGSLEAMKMLLDAGADVNAKNAFDATALIFCAGDLEKVRLLLSKGADVNARSKLGRTPLIAAAGHSGASEIVKLLLDKGADLSEPQGGAALLAATDADDTATARMLLEKGANVNAVLQAPDGTGSTGNTPLMNAASFGNIQIVKLLLAKGANVNAVSVAKGVEVKNGPIALGSFTPLLLAAAYGGPETVKLLLDAGAKVNVQDVRGMTPLMLAVSSDHADVRVVRMLLDKGADPKIKSKDGENALDWAHKFNAPPIMQALGLPLKAAAASAIPADERKPLAPRAAAEKGLVLLQRTSTGFFQQGGCVSCHAQNLTGFAATAARGAGLRVDERMQADDLKAVRLQWAAFEQPLLQGIAPPGAMDVLMYSVLHLAAADAKPDRVIDTLVNSIAGMQSAQGDWSIAGIARAPMEDGNVSRTALCLHALAAYPLPGRKAEFDQRVARAAAWLKAQRPRVTEERVMQLLGLKWANTDPKSLEGAVKELMSIQRPDGGWAQTPNLASDAYATGQVLYTLHEYGIPASSDAYRRGVAYLLKNQREDGSWYVASRAPKFQPYFQSGFPYNHDQWISSSATAWAVTALSYAAPEKSVAQR